MVRKRLQRRRDRAAGWVEVNVQVASEKSEELRAFAASQSPPAPLTDPRQLDLLDALDRQLRGSASVPESAAQGALRL